jgi:hypothetical protein
MLLAVEQEFREIDRAGTADVLDDLARPLFGLASAPLEERAVGLARAAWEALPGEGDAPADWLLACALERRTASGAVRAALAVELGRRTGIPSRPLRLHGCWAVRACDPKARMAADVGTQSGFEPTGTGMGAQCAHQVAFIVLTALASAWRAAGESAAARRASGLRLLLPLDEALRGQVRREL